METIVKAICENDKDKLWDSKLKRLIRDRYLTSLSDSSFRNGKKKLVQEGIITVQKLPFKKKKALIRLTEESRNKYLFTDLQISNTYLPKKQARDRELNELRRLNKNRRRKETEESEGARRERIVQYLLLRAVYGTTYARRVNDRLEQGLPGQIRTYLDKNDHSYSPEDIEYTLTKEQKEALVPITLEIDTIPGISIMDLVNHIDVGSGGFFRYVSTTKEECEAIVQDLISKGIFVRIAYEEVHDAITNIKHSEVYDFLLRETRYKIATEALNGYIGDWNSVHYFISKRIEATWLIRPTRLQKEIDWYEYYTGFKVANNFRTRQTLEHQKMLMAEKNNRKEEPKRKLIEAYSRERSIWDKNIQKKLKEIRNKQEYIEIRNEFPFLHEVLMKPLRHVSGILESNRRDLVW
jgi:hypothetical protein